MPPVPCPQCGTPVPENARYCGQCGFVLAPSTAMPAATPAAPPEQAPRGNLAKTMLQFAAPADLTPAAPAASPAPAPAAAPAAAPAHSPAASTVANNLGAQTLIDPIPAEQRAKTMMDFQAPPGADKPGASFAKTIVDPSPPSATVPAAAALAPQGSPQAPVPSPGIAPAFGQTALMPQVPSPSPAPSFAQTLVDPPRTGLGSEKKTMLGVAAADLVPPGMANAPPQQTLAMNNPPSPGGPNAAHQKTMLGVAMPGIAPAQSTPHASSGGQQKTMLGVAMPGIAPSQTVGLQQPSPVASAPPAPAKTAQKPVTIIGMPSPFVDDEPLPAPPSRRAKSGVPAIVVVAIVTAIVAIGGVVLFFLLRGGPPITAKPGIDAQGHDMLALTCEACPDGTVVSVGDAKATIKDKTAELVLSTPLQVGENPLVFRIERPGGGRKEDQKIVIPIAYRVRADLATLSAKPPAITIRVDATPGSTVTVDGKPLAIDAEGHGAYALDASAELEGQSIEARVLERKVPYTIATKAGAPEAGTVTARVGIVVLRLDTPLAHSIVADKSATFAGQTAPGATVIADGKPIPVDAKGGFSGAVDLPVTGEVKITLQSSAPQLAPRTMQVGIKRTDSLDAEAKAFEASSPLAFDAIATDITSKVGQRTILEGEVVDATVISHQTIALVENRRGCSLGHCLARVVYGGDAPLAKGESVRVYGRVARAFTASGKTLPEIEAEFVVKGRR